MRFNAQYQNVTLLGLHMISQSAPSGLPDGVATAGSLSACLAEEASWLF